MERAKGSCPLISLKALSFEFPRGKRVLDGLDLEVGSGEHLGLIGRSGSGKSTLLNVLAGIAPYRLRGSLFGRGTVAGNALPYGPEISSRFCAYIHQEPEDAFIEGRVPDEVAFTLRCRGEADGPALEKAAKWLDLLGIGRLATSRTSDLSGGEKQLVAIASALSAGHRLLLLDEPNSQLDPAGRMVLSKGLRRLRANDPGLTILQVEQHQEHLLRADRIALLHKGRIEVVRDTLGMLLDGPALSRGKLQMHPLATLYSNALGRGLVNEGIDAWMFVPALVKALKGKVLIDTDRRKPDLRPLPLLRMNDASYAYPGGKRGIRGIDLDLTGSGPVCIMGPNGSGKSTLGKLLCGLMEPDRGSVDRPGKGFYLFQRPGNMMFMDSVREEISTLKGEVPPQVVRALGLETLLDENPFTLSIGERQRLGIAMAYGSGAPFVILDEPFKGLDTSSLKSSFPVLSLPDFPPYILITNEAEHARLCRSLFVMERGSVKFSGDPDDILSKLATYDLLRWPLPGNLLVGRSAGICGYPDYSDITNAMQGVSTKWG